MLRWPILIYLMKYGSLKKMIRRYFVDGEVISIVPGVYVEKKDGDKS